MHASDGVSKYFLVYHQGGAMHFDGEKTLLEIADSAMRKQTCMLDSREKCEAELEKLNVKLRKTFESWHPEEEPNDRR